MTKPSMLRLKVANPMFFASDLGDYGTIHEHEIVREEGGWVFKIVAGHNTRPVYSIDENYKLEYLRHGW